MVRVNEETGNIEVVETMTFEASMLPVLREIRDELSESINDKIKYLNKDEFELMVEHGNSEACQIAAISQFLEETAEETFTNRQIAVCMQCIVDAYDEECNYPVYEPSIFDEDIIRMGIEKFLEEEWDIEND
jgi:hypothetical protein